MSLEYNVVAVYLDGAFDPEYAPYMKSLSSVQTAESWKGRVERIIASECRKKGRDNQRYSVVVFHNALPTLTL